MKTYYELLGVTRQTTSVELTAARRRLALALHPDRAGEASGPAMAEVNVAYDALADPKLQAKYRAKLRKTHTPCGACEEAGGRWKQKGFKGRTFETCRHCGGSGMVEKK